MNPYESLVAAYARGVAEGKRYPMGGFEPVAGKPAPAYAASVLIFSPHPDDECIVSGLAIRLMRESKMRVINVAVTQGSNKARQSERLAELKNACNYLGFGLIQTRPEGLERVNRKSRESDPASWEASVEIVAQVLQREQPRIILFPHQRDWNSTHIGVHLLVMDALASLGNDFECFLVETEYWGAMDDPNLMVELGLREVTDMVTGTSFHIGEVSRNPFHLLLPAWLQDNVRRGSELVGGQGEAAPDYTFATLYRLQRWSKGRIQKVLGGGVQVSASDDPGRLFLEH